MNKEDQTSVEIRNLKARRNTLKEVDIRYWREEFSKKILKLPAGATLYKELSKVDDYYSTIKGEYELRNVKSGVAGITKTSRAVRTLEKYLKKDSGKRGKSESKKSS